MNGSAADDTIVALSSGRPPAAIAVVRTSGPAALAAAERLSGGLPAPRQAVLRRLRDPGDQVLIDEAVVVRFDGPGSATGEDIVEYQCHGGRATVDRLIAVLLAQPGVRLAEPGEFTRRALANGRIDLTEAEGLADLLAAETERQRRSAMARASGAVRARLDAWRDELLALSARAEVAIDYADEEDGALDPSLAGDIVSLASEMHQLLSRPRVEPLRDGVRVVVAGPPNAGKSSLVNALAQSERAIVTDVAGTTRDVIEVPISIGGVPFVLVDTAGLRNATDLVESIGIGKAELEIEGADLVLWLGEPSEAPLSEKVIILRAKADLGQNRCEPSDQLSVSVVSGEGLSELVHTILKRAEALLPVGDELALDRRQHDLLKSAVNALERCRVLHEAVLIAEELRVARGFLDRISGRARIDDLLDTLFSRFCLGK